MAAIQKSLMINIADIYKNVNSKLSKNSLE